MKTTTTKDRTAATTPTAVFNSMDSDYQLSREDQSHHGETKDWTFKTQAPVQFSSRWYLCARKSPYALHPVSQKFPQRRQGNSSNVRLTDDGRLSSFQGRSSSASSFHASLLQAIDGVMSLALCPQAMSQSPQHFRSFEKRATCEGCFARQSICSVISLHSGMSRAVHTQEFRHHLSLTRLQLSGTNSLFLPFSRAV